jgi:hypothetical protein
MSGSDEFFIMGDGKRQDAPLHDAILNNDEADRVTRLATAKRAVASGKSKEVAAMLYGVDASKL